MESDVSLQKPRASNCNVAYTHSCKNLVDVSSLAFVRVQKALRLLGMIDKKGIKRPTVGASTAPRFKRSVALRRLDLYIAASVDSEYYPKDISVK